MEKNPKVSVIIPTYNSAQFIVETLESVFAQTYKNYEVIVVDDGSTDNTKEVLKPYMSKIRYIYKENGGPASARNVGIKNARGEYIAFLDSDDLWLSEKLERQVKYLGKYQEVVLVFTDCIRFFEDSLSEIRSCKERFISNDMFLNLWWETIIITSTVIVKKFCFDKVGFFDESKKIEGAEDYEMWLRIAREYPIGYLGEVTVKYRFRREGHNRSNITRSCAAADIVVKRYYKYIKEKYTDNELINMRLHIGHFHHGSSFFGMNYFLDARKQFTLAMKYKFDLKVLLYYLATFLNKNYINWLRKIRQKVCKYL